MGRLGYFRRNATLVVLLLCVCVLALDILLPPSIAVWVLYLLPVYAAYQWKATKHIYLITAICSLFILADLLSPVAVPFVFGVINRCLAIAVLWIVAISLSRRARLDEQLQAYQHNLEDMVKTRTTALEQEIAERKQIQADLEESKERFRLLSDISPSAVVLSRMSDATILYANPMAAKVAGLSQDELIGRNALELLFSPEQGAALTAEFEQEGSLSGAEVQVILASGDPFWAHYSAQIGKLHGEPVIVGNAVDITERKQMEAALRDLNTDLERRVTERTIELSNALAELKRLSKLKDEFMGAVSHELRTPLSAILALSESLEEQISGPLNSRQAHKVQLIRQSGDRLLILINDILSYTSLMSGRVAPEQWSYRLMEVCSGEAKRIADKVAHKRQTLQVAIEPVDLRIVSDARVMGEIMARLLDNAVKFTADGGQIGMEAHCGGAQNTIELVVWDTGIGISDQNMERIFAAFTQGNGELDRPHEGIGLGLAYVWQAVELLGGTIVVDSTLGEGSRFTITLPWSPEAVTVPNSW